jgi:hypothetical protein
MGISETVVYVVVAACTLCCLVGCVVVLKSVKSGKELGKDLIGAMSISKPMAGADTGPFKNLRGVADGITDHIKFNANEIPGKLIQESSALLNFK